jgi:DNA-binding GntR family transcriptional regulator
MTMPPTFDPDSVVPLYIQAADYVAGKILRGELIPGQRLPSERDLGIEWGVGYLTARRAVRELKDRGLVESAVGKGTFVVKQAPPA